MDLEPHELIPTAQIAAIVNSFNRLPLLQLALPSLVSALQGSGLPSAVVVYEAGSTDGSREWLAQYIQDANNSIVKVITPTGEDTSFSAGVNAACAYAATQFPNLRYYFLFETDNWIVSPEPMRAAISLLEQESSLGAAGFTVQTHAGTLAGYGCRFPTALQFVLGQQVAAHFGLDRPNHTKWKRTGGLRWRLCDVVYTSPLLIKKEAWTKTGGFDTAAFPFSDCDLDWAWRLSKNNKQMGVLDIPGVVHDNKELKSNFSLLRVVDQHRARLELLKRHRKNVNVLLKPLLFVRHCVELLTMPFVIRHRAVLRRSIHKRWILLTSVFGGYKHLHN